MSEKEEHSIYGASGAKRWRTCPGSVAVIETGKALGDIAADTSSSYSTEGDEAHKYAEQILKGEIELGDIPEAFHLHLEGYIKLCKGIKENADKVGGAVEMIEGKVPLFYRPEDQGTIDYGVYCSEWIQFIDLKYGIGVEVSAEENDQQIIYCLSLIAHIEGTQGAKLPDDMKVALGIYQPRHHSFNGKPKVWTTTVRELKDIALDIEADYEVARKGDGAIKPSKDACQFCDARGICEAQIKSGFFHVPTAIDPLAEFDDETTPEERTEVVKELVAATAPATAKKPAGVIAADPDAYTGELLTPEQVAFICANASTIKKVVDNVVDMERKRIEQGGELRGMKLVEGNKGARKWKGTDAQTEATKMLTNKFGKAGAYQPAMPLTAPQAIAKLEGEDLSTKFNNKFNGLWEQPHNKPSLVPISHKKEAIVFTAPADEFEDEELEGML